MKTAKESKKRVYTSMFDPFRADIERWCDEGLTIKEVYEKLPDGYSFQGFYSYLRTKRIVERAWRKALEARRACDSCEYCKRFKTSRGEMAGSRICTLSWRILSTDVKICPRWCEYREKEVGVSKDGNE